MAADIKAELARYIKANIKRDLELYTDFEGYKVECEDLSGLQLQVKATPLDRSLPGGPRYFNLRFSELV